MSCWTEDEGAAIFRNVGIIHRNERAPHHRRPDSPDVLCISHFFSFTLILRSKNKVIISCIRTFKYGILKSRVATVFCWLVNPKNNVKFMVNSLTSNDSYRSRTAPLTSKRCILYIYSTNISTEYFKHGIYFPLFFPLKNAVCLIILTYLVPALFTFYIQGVLKLKKIIPAT